MDLGALDPIKPYLNFFHPVIMWVLLGVSLYALYLGMKIRATRSAEGDAKKALIKGKFNSRHHRIDRKSTRLNSSHRCSSYAVFCLKKKRNKKRKKKKKKKTKKTQLYQHTTEIPRRLLYSQ